MKGTELLRQRIQESGQKKSALMKALGIKAYATFRDRVNEPSSFTANQINKLVELLKLSAKDRDRIFFANEVA